MDLSNKIPPLREAFKRKYPGHTIILDLFERANDCPATWGALSKLSLTNFVNYMSETYAPNSVNQYATKLKALLTLYSEEVPLPTDYKRILSPRKCAKTSISLTPEEIESLIIHDCRNAIETYVRNIFVVGCYTGARLSDITRLDLSNIDKQNNMLIYTSQKTKTPTYVPLKPIVVDYILNTPKLGINNVTRAGFNQIIRRLCKECGIKQVVNVFSAGKEQRGEKWKFVSSHTARKSFCTNLFRKGVDVLSISKMAGHSDMKMTINNYICGGANLQTPEVVEFFK